MSSQNYLVHHGIHVLNLNLAFLGVRGGTTLKKDALSEKPTEKGSLKSRIKVCFCSERERSGRDEGGPGRVGSGCAAAGGRTAQTPRARSPARLGQGN